MRAAATISLACLLAVLGVAEARAATVSVSGATLHVTAAPGELNQLAIAPGSGTLSITDAGAPLQAGAGCVTAGPAVECATLPLLDVAVDLGDGNDTLTATAELPLKVVDGAGNDSVTGGTAADTFIASPGADSYAGGGGTDLVTYAARPDAVVADIDNAADDGAAGETDNVRTDVERITGGDAADTLGGDGSSEQLTGGPGDDTLTGNGGDDVLDGGTGKDTLNGGSGTDTADYSARSQSLVIDLASAGGNQEDGFSSVENAVGGSGSDRLTGTTSANLLYGNAGDDVLDGGTGADRLDGGAGTDTADYSSRTAAVTADLDGNADDGQSLERDRITTDVERLIGGTGADTLTGDDDPNLLVGGAGADKLDGNGADDRLEGGDGDDRAWGDAGHDELSLGTGKDQAWGGDGNDALVAGAHDDAAYGERGDDRLYGDEGNDTLSGGDGADALAAGAGNDTLRGDAHGDSLDGGDGNDGLSGGDGDDTMAGAPGDDSLDGDGGSDTIAAGDGNDKLWGDAGNDTLAGETGNDGLAGDAGDDVVDGGSGDDRVDGGSGADGVLGDAGNDIVLGDGGADRVSGGDGADQLAGGVDDDVLVGGPGNDDVRGDDGWDTVDYAGRSEALTIDLDDQGDDGAKGEGDNVRTSVEAVIGGAGRDRITGSAATNYLYGEGGADRVDGGGGSDRLYGGAGGDSVIGGSGPDSMDGGDGADHISARDGSREAVRCGSGRDRATTDTVDMLFGCEKRTSGTANWTNTDTSKGARVRGVRARTGGGGFVDIPGFPGERIDRRLLADIAYLQRRYRVHITDGYARSGHADGGEHPIGLAVDIVPGPGGSWSDVDRLAKWAEPRQNRPRSPFRWIGYNGDRNHGRGHHLHLSWRHTRTRPGRVARTVWTLSLSKPAASGSSLASLARSTNQRLGSKPSVSTGLSSPARCSGSAPLIPIFQSAGRAFGISWKVLAGLTEIESGHGCNMGPSSAGAIGWTQFLPSTWRIWGMDATGDRRADPYNAVDAIYSSARYLRASGGATNIRRALYAYNHAWWYVNKVQRAARKY